MTNEFIPIYARAGTMAQLLDIGKSTFIELVKDNVLPDGIYFRKGKTSIKVWKVVEVCTAIDKISKTKTIIEDEFISALNDDKG